MSTRTVDIREAQEQLGELIALALEGNEVIITRHDRPLARLVPISPLQVRRVAGLNRGQIEVGADFDDPLPEEFWTGKK